MVSPKTCLILKIRLLIFVFISILLYPVQVKATARANPFKSAGKLVEEAMREVDLTGDVLLPHVEHLQRSANRAWEGLRPKQPTDLDFQVYNYAGNVKKKIICLTFFMLGSVYLVCVIVCCVIMRKI